MIRAQAAALNISTSHPQPQETICYEKQQSFLEMVEKVFADNPQAKKAKIGESGSEYLNGKSLHNFMRLNFFDKENDFHREQCTII